MKTKRNVVIDNIKALGIILVIMGHVTHNHVLGNWIYSFHMPLFFFLSGVMFLFSHKDHFIRRRVKSLLIPFWSFGVLSFLYWVLIEARMRGISVTPDVFTKQLLSLAGVYTAVGNSLLFNIVLWFLPCLFVSEMVVFLFIKRVNKVKLIGGGVQDSSLFHGCMSLSSIFSFRSILTRL